jgi:hypothetical protein
MLEAHMAGDNSEQQNDFARGYVAKAVLDVLKARHIDVPVDVRDRILGCKDTAVLHKWLARAVKATSASEVTAE